MVLALILAFMIVGLSSLISASTHINDQAAVDADSFAKKQTVYSLCDLAYLQFSRDLQAITVTHNTGEDWVGAKGAAIYSQALEALQASVTLSDGKTWTCVKLEDLTEALGIKDPAAIACFQKAVGGFGSKAEIELALVEDLSLNWSSKDCRVSKTSASIPLNTALLAVTCRKGTNETTLELELSGLTLESETYKDLGETVYAIGGTACLERITG